MATRSQLFNRLGLNNPVINPLLDSIYKAEEQQRWELDLFNEPHGYHWSTSFHSSSFPGDDPKACGRKSLYTMMNFPSNEPSSRRSRSYMETGKMIEEQIVWRFHRAGILLSDSPEAEVQMGFVDKEHWLTCAPDSIIQIPRTNKPHLVELKTKAPDKIIKMQSGQLTFDPYHRNQILTQIGLARKDSLKLWPNLDQLKDGTLLYLSRDNSADGHEYKFSHNEEFFQQGLDTLKDWKQSFIEDELPPRPKEWKWTESPCKYCPFKKNVCKPDYVAKTTKLSKSEGIKWAKEVRGSYDAKKQRKRVLDRWSPND